MRGARERERRFPRLRRGGRRRCRASALVDPSADDADLTGIAAEPRPSASAARRAGQPVDDQAARAAAGTDDRAILSAFEQVAVGRQGQPAFPLVLAVALEAVLVEDRFHLALVIDPGRRMRRGQAAAWGRCRAGVDLGCGVACAGVGAAARETASSEPAQTQTPSVRPPASAKCRGLFKGTCGFISVVNPDVSAATSTYVEPALIARSDPTRCVTLTGSGIRVAISGAATSRAH